MLLDALQSRNLELARRARELEEQPGGSSPGDARHTGGARSDGQGRQHPWPEEALRQGQTAQRQPRQTRLAAHAEQQQSQQLAQQQQQQQWQGQWGQQERHQRLHQQGLVQQQQQPWRHQNRQQQRQRASQHQLPQPALGSMPGPRQRGNFAPEPRGLPAGPGGGTRTQRRGGQTTQPPRDREPQGRRGAVGEAPPPWAEAHERGTCTPCFFHMLGICEYGRRCVYCHGPHTRPDWNRLRPPRHIRQQLRARGISLVEAFRGNRVPPADGMAI